MTFTFATIIFVLIIHFFADFAVQTHEQAINKSTDEKYLTYHVGSYSLLWFIASYCIFQDWSQAFMFGLITFGAHWVTDYITSKIAKQFFSKDDYHNGFVVIGIDQVLHYIQLFLTLHYIQNVF